MDHPLPHPSYNTVPHRQAVHAAIHAASKHGDPPPNRGEYPAERERQAPNDPPLILIVDDDRAIRESLVMVLENEGLQCLMAQNGADALDLLRKAKSRPDLIVLDLMMPVMTGREFRRAQLADHALADIPTLVLSAASDTASQAHDMVVTRTLQKPVNLDVLLKAVEHLIPGWQPRG
jgi:CheY-like chemotaxis protein